MNTLRLRFARSGRTGFWFGASTALRSLLSLAQGLWGTDFPCMLMDWFTQSQHSLVVKPFALSARSAVEGCNEYYSAITALYNTSSAEIPEISSSGLRAL